ncbi:MAG: DNA polymerase/3'-5' exonuclease PolX [Dehalococcoidales bacterium]|nr:DNA polymerase/3'-5' exonuclease PolX [Dehalococcoidales bacterium]
MKNSEIARVFTEISDLLKLKGENIFKIRAYQKAARSIEQQPIELEQMLKEGCLREVPGVGEAIAKKITELLATGRLEFYENLKAEFPPGINALLDVPGVGPKTAIRLSAELGIRNVDELEAAITDGRVAHLYRMGDKTAENILRQIQLLRVKKTEHRIPIAEAVEVVEEIKERLKNVPGLKNLVAAGSLRRFKETIGDIDLMGTADNAGEVIKAFTSLATVRGVLGSGPTKASVVVSGGLKVDLRIVEHEAFGSLLQYSTGSKQHNINLRERARRLGLSLSEYGITDIETGKLEKFDSEEAFYRRQGLAYIPPELREGQMEIDLAEKGSLPALVDPTDIMGDFHVHTDWSDGRGSIEEMALAAKELGYQYIGICDHSPGRHGLTADRLKEQSAVIKELNRKIDGIRILSGIEVDIKADGSLDMPDDVLAELDIVVAGVHSAMGQEQSQMTARIIQAIENPNVDIIAHPTCRLLQEREPVALDIEAVFQAAARHKTLLEINAFPNRLDLKDNLAYRARELGIKLVIDTDAHNAGHLPFMRFGVGVARRGWCQAQDILNTRPLEEVAAYLASRG